VTAIATNSAQTVVTSRSSGATALKSISRPSVTTTKERTAGATPKEATSASESRYGPASVPP